jgi:8-oxo-dGTP pyrophosphatase MutT (NUDIX family)
VLVLIYPHDSEWLLPLTRRTDTVAAHRGQISFTGGAREPGESAEQAALREASEEIGLDPRRVEVLGALSELHIPRSNFLVTPIVGAAAARPPFAPHAPEVAEILEVSLTTLLDPRTVEEHTMQLASGDAQVPFFRVGPHRVWGATAMILAEFLAVVRAAG